MPAGSRGGRRLANGCGESEGGTNPAGCRRGSVQHARPGQEIQQQAVEALRIFELRPVAHMGQAHMLGLGQHMGQGLQRIGRSAAVVFAAHQQHGQVQMGERGGPAVKGGQRLQGAAVGPGIDLRERVRGQAHARRCR